MATAVAPATTFDPYKVGLGAEIDTPQFFFGESPFGWICRARRAAGTIYMVYSTEHTTTDYLDEMWSEISQWGLVYHSHIQCKKVPPMFGRKVKTCYIHYYATHVKGLLVGISKAQFLAAQELR